jgi:hypothetical protein
MAGWTYPDGDMSNACLTARRRHGGVSRTKLLAASDLFLRSQEQSRDAGGVRSDRRRGYLAGLRVIARPGILYLPRAAASPMSAQTKSSGHIATAVHFAAVRALAHCNGVPQIDIRSMNSDFVTGIFPAPDKTAIGFVAMHEFESAWHPRAAD